MKYLFALIAVLLTAVSGLVWNQMPQGGSDREIVIYWTTDPNPARIEQIRLFDEWQIERGLSEDVLDADGNPVLDEDGQPVKQPLIELRLDTGNSDKTKKVIQAVSGVAADTIDLNSGFDMRFFAEMNVLEDVTEVARDLGFSTDTSFAALQDELSLVSLDGERQQYQYPCNVAFQLLYVNKDVFEEVGMPPPPERWSVEEFERLGLEFVSRANEPDQRTRRKFFVDALDTNELMRSFGVDVFNETLTDVNIEHPDAIEATRLIRKWIFQDRLIPTAADKASEAQSGGYGGGGAELFENGRYAMMRGGRWHLIRFRQTQHRPSEQGRNAIELRDWSSSRTVDIPRPSSAPAPPRCTSTARGSIVTSHSNESTGRRSPLPRARPGRSSSCRSWRARSTTPRSSPTRTDSRRTRPLRAAKRIWSLRRMWS